MALYLLANTKKFISNQKLCHKWVKKEIKSFFANLRNSFLLALIPLWCWVSSFGVVLHYLKSCLYSSRLSSLAASINVLHLSQNYISSIKRGMAVGLIISFSTFAIRCYYIRGKTVYTDMQLRFKSCRKYKNAYPRVTNYVSGIKILRS